MKKVGILGGTFNPIHAGHIAIAEAAYRQLNLNEIWIMPAGNPPHKSKAFVAPDALRLAMIREMIASYPYMHCSTYEIDKEEISYTAWTLTELVGMYPDILFYYIVGSDSLCYMEHWYEPEIIFEMAHIVAAYRSTETLSQIASYAEYLRRLFDAKITLIHNDAVDISSSEIRRRCSRQEDISDLVPPAVATIIREHHLYSDIRE